MDPVKDPVCGMTVDSANSIRMTYNARDYYFCSTSCSRAFQADPARYADRSDAPYTVSAAWPRRDSGPRAAADSRMSRRPRCAGRNERAGRPSHRFGR